MCEVKIEGRCLRAVIDPLAWTTLIMASITAMFVWEGADGTIWWVASFTYLLCVVVILVSVVSRRGYMSLTVSEGCVCGHPQRGEPDVYSREDGWQIATNGRQIKIYCPEKTSIPGLTIIPVEKTVYVLTPDKKTARVLLHVFYGEGSHGGSGETTVSKIQS